MLHQKLKDRSVRILLCAAVLCLLLAAILLWMQGNRTAPVFAEFSENDALDGKADCCLNALTVLDRYAGRTDSADSAQLCLVYYLDQSDRPVVLSLLVEPNDPLYEHLAPYWPDTYDSATLMTVSGYFFADRLSGQGAGAETLFQADANAFAQWYAEQYGESVAMREIVLTFAGRTEEAYMQAVRTKTLWMRIAAIALASVGALFAALIPIRITLKRKRRITQ